MHRRPLQVAAAGLALSLAVLPAAIDDDGDGYDDLWQRVHAVSVAEFPLDADSDHDGTSNRGESAAGTDPRNPTERVAILDAELEGSSSVRLQVETRPGKRYQVEEADSPGGPTWTAVGGPATGTGSIITFTFPIPPGTPRKFQRVTVSDQDRDGDGASDWAESVLGTDPDEARSPGNASGGVATDGDTLRSLLSVSVSTSVPEAIEAGAVPGQIRVQRSFGSMPLVVPLEILGDPDPVRGSASPADYTLGVPGGNTVAFAPGAATADVDVLPVGDGAVEVPETVRFRIDPLSGAAGPSPLEASVRILDAAVAPQNRRLYVAYLGREAGVPTTATGVATALVEGDNAAASVSLTFSNLSSVQNTAYIRMEGGQQEVARIPNGQITGFSWNIRATGLLLTDQATLDALRNGSLYVSISSAEFPGGEIRGTFSPTSGSVVDPPPPPDPPPFDTPLFPNLAASGTAANPALDRDIARFLMQATFGPTPESIQEVRDLIAANGNDALAGYTAWIDRQFSTAPGDAPSPSLLTLVQAADLEEFILRSNQPATYANDPQFGGNSTQFDNTSRTWLPSSIHQNNYPFDNNRRREWWTLVVNSRDQLRQRMALALSEIVVISENDATVDTFHYGAARYWDILAENAFGPYRTILERVTYSPMMAIYLSHLKNQKQSGSISPDENFAREIMQLFSIGLVQRHLNGSLKLDPSSGLPIPTYDQGDITELARVMTGLSFGKRHATVSAPTYPTATNQSAGAIQDNTNFFQGSGHRFWQAPWTHDLAMFGAYHDFNEYSAYTGLPLPDGVPAASKILFRDKAGQAVLPLRTQSDANGRADVSDALDALAGHPNTSVFLSRLLIQRFTTANPSAGYLHRVATQFRNTNGDLGEVLKAILLDHEVRTLPASGSPTPADAASHGKPKEPLIHFIALVRALGCVSRAPLAHLATMPVTFTSAQSPVTAPYPADELAKFPAGATRFRWFDTDGNLAQSPLRAPSVFNWFLPDYLVPGPLASAGLVAPELQVATESNVVNVVNQYQSLCFTGTWPTVYNAAQLAAGTRLGRSVDNFFNLSTYRTAGGSQLSVPSYGLPADAAKPEGRGYFLRPQFTESVPNEVPESINDQLDNVLPDVVSLHQLYRNAYLASLAAQYGSAGNVPASPGTSQKAIAHGAAAETILDHFDLLLAAGYLKAKYGSGGSTPRQAILDALASGNMGNLTYHSDHASYDATVVSRCKNLAYLVATSAQALILK